MYGLRKKVKEVRKIDNRSLCSNLVKQLQSRLNINHRFYDVKRKVIGLEKLMSYDKYVYTNLYWTFSLFGEKETITYIINSAEVLGKQYQLDLKEAVKEGWYNPEGLDNSNKSVFWNVYGHHPYIQYDYSGYMANVINLAYAFGSAMYCDYMNKNTPYIAISRNTTMLKVYSYINRY